MIYHIISTIATRACLQEEILCCAVEFSNQLHALYFIIKCVTTRVLSGYDYL